MSALPILLDAAQGKMMVVGDTPAAFSKLEILGTRGCQITWIPAATGRDEARARLSVAWADRVEIVSGEIQKSDLESALAVVTAAGDETDQLVARWARERGVPVNVVDRPELSTFSFPAIVDRGDLVVAVGTSGKSPVLARRVREQIEVLLPAAIADLCAFLGRQRERLRAKPGRGALDRSLWEKAIDGQVAHHVMEGRVEEAERLLDQIVVGATPKLGMVTLVGAGPGDPDLLTLKAHHALQQADVIFYDALVTPEILGRARRDARKVFVGRRKGAPGPDQADINKLLIEAASAGARVVRLKGGDPFVFGRGGEEVEALVTAGITASVVPGITAVLGCAAEAEIPLTFRDQATKLVILTAHQVSGDAAIDWSACADPKATLAIYMSGSSAISVRDGLIAAGRPPHTPAAILARGTRPDATALVGPLTSLPRLAAQAGEGPALLIVGSVVALGKAWREAGIDAALSAVA